MHVPVHRGSSARLEYDVPDATGMRSVIIEVVNGKLVHSSVQGGQVLATEVTRLTWCPLPDGSIVALDQLDRAWPVPACHVSTFKALANLAKVPIRLGEARPAPIFAPEGISTSPPPAIPEGVATVAPLALNVLFGQSPERKSGIGHGSPVGTAPNACSSMLGPTMAVATSQSRAPGRKHSGPEAPGHLPEAITATGSTQLRNSEVSGFCGVGSIRSPLLEGGSVYDEASEGASLCQPPVSEALEGSVSEPMPSPGGSAVLGASDGT